MESGRPQEPSLPVVILSAAKNLWWPDDRFFAALRMTAKVKDDNSGSLWIGYSIHHLYYALATWYTDPCKQTRADADANAS